MPVPQTKAEKVKLAVEKVRLHLDAARTAFAGLHDVSKNNTVVADVVNVVNGEFGNLEHAATELASITSDRDSST